VLLLASASGRAHAEELPAVETREVTPPRLSSDPGVSYPEQALREHAAQPVTVELVLEVSASGRVSDAKVSSPERARFDELALAAARRLVFEPARRDGRPVAARIRFRYVFTPPPARLSGRVLSAASERPIAGANVTVRDAAQGEHRAQTDSDGRWKVPELPPGPVEIAFAAPGRRPERATEVLERGQETSVLVRLEPDAAAPIAGQPAITEVVVTGERPPREVTKRTLGRDEIAHSAGTQGDALLSLQNLPGIARPPPFSGQLAVRGSAPDDTGIFIQGTEVPLAYHFGGLSSVVPTELLEKIDFYPGNYSARYGRFMGGIVDVGLRAPQSDRYHLLVENSVLGLRGLVEGPIARGWSFYLGGQRSWLDLVFTPILKASGDKEVALPHWADYQAALHKDFSAGTSLTLSFFGSDDGFDIVSPIAASSDPTLGGALGYHTSFWRTQARFDAHPAEGTQLHLTAAFGEDSISASLGTTLLVARLHPLSGRAELTQTFARGVVGDVGFDVQYEPYEFALQLPAPTRAGIPPGGPGQPPLRSTGSDSLFLPAAYAELELEPWRGARVVPGLRLDYDGTTRHADLSPRLNLRQDLTAGFPRTILKGGVGYFMQPPSPLDTDAHFGQAGLSSNRSLQTDFGIEQEFSRQLELSLDVFYKRLDRLVVAEAGNAGSGAAYGVEWLLRYKADRHFFGWVSYTLSRSERRDLASEPLRPFEFDQTHVLTLLGNYKLGKGWQLGGRFRLGSGDRYTSTSPGAYDASMGSQLGVAAFPPYDQRLPVFHQLDLRLERLRVYRYCRVTWFLDVQNVYFRNNPLGVTYNYNYTQKAYVNGLPILPIAGVRAEF
jgi:TonB family protein